MNEYLQSVDIFKSLGRYRKPLIIVGAISLLASIIFSSPVFIKPKFKSTAIIYPNNLTAYSQESPTEQMIQLLESADIRDRIIKSFNLYKHYDIDSLNDKYYRFDVVKMFGENVAVNKTEYESVDISVYDTSPDTAAAIVDSMIEFMNIKARSLQREKSMEIVNIAKQRMMLKKEQMDSVENLMQQYRTQYGLLDYKTQAREYTKALSGKNQKGAEAAKKMLTVLAEKGGQYDDWSEHLWRIRGSYNDLRLDYENALKDVTKVLTYENIITYPVPSDKKAYPVRWLIVLVSVVVTLFLAFVIILTIESSKPKTR